MTLSYYIIVFDKQKGKFMVEEYREQIDMSLKQKPPKWVDVYPQGTKEGDEEQGVFICLARNAKWTFRSLAQIAKETNLTKERVEEILQKYWRKGMVFQNPSNEDQWAYWERIPDMLPTKKTSITEEDQKNRIEGMKK